MPLIRRCCRPTHNSQLSSLVFRLLRFPRAFVVTYQPFHNEATLTIFQQLKKLYELFGAGVKAKFAILVCLMVVVGLAELVGIGVIPAFLGVVIYPEKVLTYPTVGDFLAQWSIDTPERLLLFGS